jgi:hypothetical protein
MPIPFIGLSFGLLDHRSRMGSALWLYLFLHTRADFRDPSGLVKWTKEEAAEKLEVDSRTILRWYQTLKDEGYVKPVADDLVQEKTTIITKYKNVPIMASGTCVQGGDKSVQGGDKTVTPGMTNVSPPSFLYKDLRYRTLKGFFEAVVDMINQAHNPIAELREFWAFVWGPEDTPTFGRLGEAAKRAGNGQSRPGCRVLAMRSVVAAVGRRVIGNPVDYVQNMKGVMGGPDPGARRRRVAPPEPQWHNPDHGDWRQFILTGEDARSQGDPLP